MTNPFNPLDWIKSAQDWFSKTERSSGFRPYLIFLIITFGMAIFLLSVFSSVPKATDFALALISIAVVAFIILFAIKCFQDPDFCRSESHVETMKKIEVEKLGSDIYQVEAEVIERKMLTESVPETNVLPDFTALEDK